MCVVVVAVGVVVVAAGVVAGHRPRPAHAAAVVAECRCCSRRVVLL